MAGIIAFGAVVRYSIKGFTVKVKVEVYKREITRGQIEKIKSLNNWGYSFYLGLVAKMWTFPVVKVGGETQRILWKHEKHRQKSNVHYDDMTPLTPLTFEFKFQQ